VSIRSILIPIGLKTSLSPLDFLDYLIPDKSSVEVTLMTVVTLPSVTSLEQNEIEELDIVKESNRKLDESAEILSRMGFKVRKKILYSRDVAEAIIEESIQNPYDLIILIKRRKVPKFIGRSISKSVLPRIFKPILVLTME